MTNYAGWEDEEVWKTWKNYALIKVEAPDSVFQYAGIELEEETCLQSNQFHVGSKLRFVV